jgi:hypothetical protein
MAVIYYPGFITKEEAAHRQRVTLKTINIQIQEKRIASVTLDGLTFIRDTTLPAAPPPSVVWNELQWVRNFARQNKITSDRIYEQILLGKITAVIIANRVFVTRNEAALLTFASIAAKSGKRQVFF